MPANTRARPRDSNVRWRPIQRLAKETCLRCYVCSLLLVCVVAVAEGAPPMPPKGNHPVLGAWSWRVQNGNCVETYLFRADGTTLVTSGANVGESAYEISAEPSSMGFYRWNDRITKDNGKRDC